jgi:hypothetical protein
MRGLTRMHGLRKMEIRSLGRTDPPMSIGNESDQADQAISTG